MSIESEYALKLQTERVIEEAASGLAVTMILDKDRIVLSLMDMCLENTLAIRVLLGGSLTPRLYTPAASLMQPAFQMFVRGSWAQYVATSDDIAELAIDPKDEGRWPLSFEEMLQRVHATDFFGDYLMKARDKADRAMQNALREGTRLIGRVTGHATRTAFVADSVAVEMLRYSNILALLAALVIFDVTRHTGGYDACERQLERIVDSGI